MHISTLLHHILQTILLSPDLAARFHKLFYAILLSPLAPQQSISNQIQSVRARKKANYRRLRSTVNIIDYVMPGIASKLSQGLYINDSFPWKPVDIRLIAYGTGAAVLKLNWKNGDKVLRIYRKSVWKSYSGLLEIAEHYKKNYERMLTWYGDLPGLVLPMEFMVLRGSPLIGPVAVSLQPYIHGEKQDLFEDFSDDELLQLFAENHCLLEDFMYFAKQTIRQWDERNMCFDFLGRQNVMLVTQDGYYKLCLPDSGFVSFDKLLSKGPEVMARFEQCMKRIVSLYELTQELEPVY